MVKSGKQAKIKGGLAESPSHLMHRVLQLSLDIYAEEAGPDGLTQRQFAVLEAVSVRSGLTQTDLVKATGIDRSTLADLVARMTAKGLLERERSTLDARAKAVRLSEAGQTALADAGAGGLQRGLTGLGQAHRLGAGVQRRAFAVQQPFRLSLIHI